MVNFPNRLENRLETFYWFAKKNEKTADPVLDLVCFSQCSFKFFDFMLQRPNIFCALLDIYKKLNGFNEFLVYAQRKYPKELTSFLHSIKESTAKNFSSQILLHNLEDMTLLQWSDFFDKRNFSAILAIIANTPEGDIWLASQLARRKPETGKVGLQIFWETSGKQHLPAFLAIIEKSNNEGAVAYLVLALKNNIKRNSQSVLEYLCSDKGFSENHLKLILKIISQSESQSTIFFKWLTSPNQESWMPLQSLFDKDPKHLIPFLEEAKKNSNIANYIVPALGRPSPSGWTISSIIKDPYCLSLAGQALEEISKLLSVLVKNKEKVRNSSYSPFWQTSLLTSRKCDGKTRYIDLSENWTLTPELKI